ncbi:32620_t:CDS:2, partial [Gigaspora margarita]
KWLADTIKYTSPIIAISDNTKIKKRLGFFSLLGYIVSSTLSTELTRVFTHEDIYHVVETIKSHNAIAFQVHIYLLQIEEDDSFSNRHSQLTVILGSTQSRNINIEITVDIGVVNGVLKLSKLVNQHRYYEAYTSQKMEKRVVGSSTSTPSNGYNSLISYLFSNESARSGILRQNQ